MKTTTIMKTNLKNQKQTAAQSEEFMKLESISSNYLTLFFNNFLNKEYEYSIIPDYLKTPADAIIFSIDEVLQKAFNVILVECKVRETDYDSEGYSLDLPKFQKLKRIQLNNNYEKIFYINFIKPTNKFYLWDITELQDNDFCNERTVVKFTAIKSDKIKKRYVNLKITDAIFSDSISNLKEVNTVKKDINNLNLKDYIKLTQSFKIIETIK